MMSALAAMVAVLAFGAMGAGSASAFHPLFLTENGGEQLFSGEGGPVPLPTLRGLNAGVLGTITCEKVLVDGFALNKSTLAHRVKIEFHGNCTQHLSGTLTACEPKIVVKEALAELGLVLPGTLTVGILVVPSSSTEFVKVTCGSNVTTVEGAVIGEIPEVNKNNVNQYNKLLTESEQVFEAQGKNTDKQVIESIELLGVSMPGELKVSGFFGGKASEEATAILKNSTKIEICTKEPQNCTG